MSDSDGEAHDPEYLLDRLEGTTGDLPDDLRRAILEVEPNDAIVPGLIDILHDDTLRPSDVRDPSPPSYAAVLLGLKAGAEAIEPLLEVVASQPTTSRLFNSASQALGTIGEAALEATVERWSEASDPDVRERLAMTLGELRETGDERIVEVLVEELERRDDSFERTSWLVQISRLAQGSAFDEAEIANRLRAWFDDADLDPSNALDESLIASYEQTMERLVEGVSVETSSERGGETSSSGAGPLGPAGDLFQQGGEDEENGDEGHEELEQIHEDLFLDEETELSEDGISLEFGTLRYDADERPDPETWLEASEEERIDAVRYHHRSLEDHPPVQNEEAHYALHAAVEELIAREAAGADDTCRRLVEEGDMRRHRAVHTIARELFDLLDPVMERGEPLDNEAIAERLREIEPSD